MMPYLRNVEQVLLTKNGTAREVDKGDTRGLIRHLRCPVCEHVLADLLRPLAPRGCLLSLFPVFLAKRTPFEVDDAFNLHALLALKTHSRELVDANLRARRDACDILVVGTPLQCWPGHLLFTLALGRRYEERAKEVASLDIPDGRVIAFIFG